MEKAIAKGGCDGGCGSSGSKAVVGIGLGDTAGSTT